MISLKCSKSKGHNFVKRNIRPEPNKSSPWQSHGLYMYIYQMVAEGRDN